MFIRWWAASLSYSRRSAARSEPMADYQKPTDPSWRELARRVQEEADPAKMIELIRELIGRFVANDVPELFNKGSNLFPISLYQHAFDECAGRFQLLFGQWRSSFGRN